LYTLPIAEVLVLLIAATLAREYDVIAKLRTCCIRKSIRTENAVSKSPNEEPDHLVGASRQSVNRALHALEKSGLIKIAIEIHDARYPGLPGPFVFTAGIESMSAPRSVETRHLKRN